MQIHTKFSGELSFQVWGADSIGEDGSPLPGAKPKQETPFKPQMITDAFFENWLNGTTLSREALFSYCGVGSGTTSATAADTTISQIGTRFTRYYSGTIYSVSSNVLTTTLEYRSTQGQIIGTISEVGLFSATSGGQTMMRSLIKDAGNNATTLSLGASDFLYVKWRVSTTVNFSDVTGTVVIAGLNYNYTIRPCFWTANLSNGSSSKNNFCIVNSVSSVNDYLGFYACNAYATQVLGSVTSGPGGVSYSGSRLSNNSYTAGSKQRKMTYRWGIDEGNTGSGIGSILLHNQPSGVAGYQISFAAVSGGGTIPKDNTKEFTIGITFSFGR